MQEFQLTSYANPNLTCFLQDEYFNPSKSKTISQDAGEDIEFEKSHLIELIQRNINVLLESMMRSMIHILLTSKGLQERIGINEHTLKDMDVHAIFSCLTDRLHEERDMREGFPDFLDSLNERHLTEHFVWCEADEDLKPIMWDLIHLLKFCRDDIENEPEKQLDLNQILQMQRELEEACLKSQDPSLIKDVLWVGKQGLIQTGNALILTKKAFGYSLEAFKILCNMATLLGVAALVVQSPYLPIMEILFKFACTRLL